MSAIHTLYYTDPVCPWSWAFEPSFRRLLWEFEGQLEIDYVMCGMRREVEDPAHVALQAVEAAARSGMPVDPRIWLDHPPGSSHPACIAVKAAADQDAAGRYLRRLREGLFCRMRKLDNAASLAEEARAVPGIDVERFEIDLRSRATLEAFGADLERAKAVPSDHHAEGSERVKLPSLEFRDADGEVHGVYGYSEYDAVREVALAAGASRPDRSPPWIGQALARFAPIASAEVTAICQLPGPPASAELWRLASEWARQGRARPERRVVESRMRRTRIMAANRPR